MSRFITTLRIALAGLLFFIAAGNRASAQGYPDDAYGSGSGSYQQFYDDLSPYGQWVNDNQYGYVWVPDAGDDFRPYYSNGYWTNTDYGNTWVSNYRWGWAPFHYGRWTYSDYYGWLWIPGNVWGPAWVSWRSGGNAYGWAPLGPGISINIGLGGYSCPDYWWTFTPQQYILNPRFQSYCYGPRYAPQYVHQTTIINNTYVTNNYTYIAGPRRGDMERAIGRRVEPVAISNTRRPGGTELRGNNLNIYRPAIAETAPRNTERPRQFRTAEQPIGAVGNGGRQVAPANGREGLQPNERGRDIQPAQQDAVRNGTFQRDPRLQSPEPVRNNDVRNSHIQEAQPDRSRVFGDRMPTQAPTQQVAPTQQIDRQRDFDQNAQIQRAQQDAQRTQDMQRAQDAQRTQVMQQQRVQEMQRAQDAQRTQALQQQRAQEMQRSQQIQQQRQQMPAVQDRQPMQQQRVEQPRMDAPRQIESPRQEAVPAQRQPMGGGEGRRPFGR